MAISWTVSNIEFLALLDLGSGELRPSTCEWGFCDDDESGDGLTSVLLSLLGVALLRPVITHLRRRKIADIYNSFFQLQNLHPSGSTYEQRLDLIPVADRQMS